MEFQSGRTPVVHIGDSIIFKHKYHYNLYIFQNQRAFDLCNFTQATVLSKPNTTSYTGYPSRPGFFYFTFSDDSSKACQASEKFAIKVSKDSSSSPPETSTITPELSPVAAPAPAPSSGGAASSSPVFPWPYRPHQADSPSPAPGGASSPATLPLLPDKGGGIPFINSNPAVPLPTGEVDSATIRPLPTSGHEGQVMMGLLGFQMALALCLVFLML
ncbi:early nodulin-like protein 1 [Quillaja saponaria]|uniref:Early nodulin-like protein 1 n=1 Tax=Quillaja saponaria TaxID=32244 RepID=A0AAD7Q382_QUISA|nr:early nodulin-like protein 1 [Quillaja saponaria]